MLNVILYTKEGCGLCDEVKLELKHLSTKYPHSLIEIDITFDQELFVKYRHAIPVVKLGFQELRAPISSEELREILTSSFPAAAS